MDEMTDAVSVYRQSVDVVLKAERIDAHQIIKCVVVSHQVKDLLSSELASAQRFSLRSNAVRSWLACASSA